MKRLLSFVLVIAICLCLPCTVFAAASSPDNTAPSGPADTGDTAQVGLWLLIMLLALAAIVVATVFYRKSLKNSAA